MWAGLEARGVATVAGSWPGPADVGEVGDAWDGEGGEAGDAPAVR